MLAFIFEAPIPVTALEGTAILFVALLGLADDRWDIRARYKAIACLVLAVVLSLGAYHWVTPTAAPFQFLWFTLPFSIWTVFPLLVVMFWSLPQAFNLIDGANGLAIGFALVVMGSLWVAGYPHPLTIGGLIGCLLWNWPRARLFLGDCGSLSIGLLVVIFAQKNVLTANPNHMLWLFAYPIADVLLVMAIRKTLRRPIFCGDRNHLHFQLQDRFPRFQRLVVPLLLGISALCNSAIYLQGAWQILPGVGLILLLLFAAWAFLASTVVHRNRETANSADPVPPSSADTSALPAK
ncbi:MAG TPA: MraY family glycosyltransferase [Holophaga sp.]|nr:MraY family glycosyltransferase [Holophaga sp.]